MKSEVPSSSWAGSSGKRRIGIAAPCLLGAIGILGVAPVLHAGPVPTYTLTLTPTDKKAGEAYQQQADDPCVLGDESCKSPVGWYHPITNNGGSEATIDKWSFGTVGKNSPTNLHQWMAGGYLQGKNKDDPVGPFYTFSQLSNVLTCGLIDGCAPAAPTDSIGFFIGIDTNGSSKPQNLSSFDIWECTYSPPGTPGSPASCGWLAGFENPDPGTPNLTDPDTGTGWTNYILTANGLKFSAGNIYAFHAVYQQNGGSDSFFLINGGSPPDEVVPLPGTLALLGLGLLGLIGARRAGAAGTG